MQYYNQHFVKIFGAILLGVFGRLKLLKWIDAKENEQDLTASEVLLTSS